MSLLLKVVLRLNNDLGSIVSKLRQDGIVCSKRAYFTAGNQLYRRNIDSFKRSLKNVVKSGHVKYPSVFSDNRMKRSEVVLKYSE